MNLLDRRLVGDKGFESYQRADMDIFALAIILASYVFPNICLT